MVWKPIGDGVVGSNGVLDVNALVNNGELVCDIRNAVSEAIARQLYRTHRLLEMLPVNTVAIFVSLGSIRMKFNKR